MVNQEIGSIVNSNIIQKTINKVTEISCAGFKTIIKNIDEEVLATGQNTSGELGTGTNTNVKNFTKVNVPDIENAKVKYIKAGKTSSVIELTDGKAYTVRNK